MKEKDPGSRAIGLGSRALRICTGRAPLDAIVSSCRSSPQQWKQKEDLTKPVVAKQDADDGEDEEAGTRMIDGLTERRHSLSKSHGDGCRGILTFSENTSKEWEAIDGGRIGQHLHMVSAHNTPIDRPRTGE